MVRPFRPAECRDVEAGDSTALLQGDTVPVRLAGPMPRIESICEERLHFEDVHSHVSLVKFCESLFGLPALNQRDAQADDMSDCFNFQQTPAQPPPTKT